MTEVARTFQDRVREDIDGFARAGGSPDVLTIDCDLRV